MISTHLSVNDIHIIKLPTKDGRSVVVPYFFIDFNFVKLHQFCFF
jgi:hypothetical protein